MDHLTIPKIRLNEVTRYYSNEFNGNSYSGFEKYDLPIELLMENAGFQLARLTANFAEKDQKIMIASGPGNNGGIGLVAARRLISWGYKLSLVVPLKNLAPLPMKELKRVLELGAALHKPSDCDVFIDAIFGSSQRLPLPTEVKEIILQTNASNCFKISLDLPTGINLQSASPIVKANIVLSLGSPEKILFEFKPRAKILIADIGIPLKQGKPGEVKNGFPFERDGMVEIE